MISMWYERHQQVPQNLKGLVVGHMNPGLTDQGREDARLLWIRWEHVAFDICIVPDLNRAIETAEIVFAGRDVPIVQEARIRGVNFGDYEGRPRLEVAKVRDQYIDKPFPNGESLTQVLQRFRSFLTDLANERDGQTVMIVGTGSDSVAIFRHLVYGVPLIEALRESGGLPPMLFNVGA